MLAVASPPHGRGTTLAGAATLSQALLIQRGLGTGGRAPGKILLSRALTATHVASCRTKIVYPQKKDYSSRAIGQSHNTTENRLASRLYPQPRRQSNTAFATGCQPDGGDLLAVSDRHPRPRLHKVGEARGFDFARAVRIAAGKFANGEEKLDTTARTGHITQDSAIMAMNR